MSHQDLINESFLKAMQVHDELAEVIARTLEKHGAWGQVGISLGVLIALSYSIRVGNTRFPNQDAEIAYNAVISLISALRENVNGMTISQLFEELFDQNTLQSMPVEGHA